MTNNEIIAALIGADLIQATGRFYRDSDKLSLLVAVATGVALPWGRVYELQADIENGVWSRPTTT